MRSAHKLGRRTLVAAVASALALGAAGCSPAQSQPSASTGGATTTVTVRMWDEQWQKAYDASFAEFTKQNPTIAVKTVLVPWADYFTKLRTDVSGDNAEDIFMMNGSYLQPYTSGSVIEIGSPRTRE